MPLMTGRANPLKGFELIINALVDKEVLTEIEGQQIISAIIS